MQRLQLAENAFKHQLREFEFLRLFVRLSKFVEFKSTSIESRSLDFDMPTASC